MSLQSGKHKHVIELKSEVEYDELYEQLLQVSITLLLLF